MCRLSLTRAAAHVHGHGYVFFAVHACGTWLLRAFWRHASFGQLRTALNGYRPQNFYAPGRTGAQLDYRCLTGPHCQRRDTNTTACMYTCPFPVSHMHMNVVRGPHILLWHLPQTPLKARGCCCKSVHGQPRTVAKLTHTRACDFKAARQVSQSHPHAKRKSRSYFTPDPGRHRPQHPCTQGRACAHVNVNVNVITFGS